MSVGAGEVTLRPPADTAVHAEARVVTGTVAVDGRSVRAGVDLRRTDDTGPSPVATVVVDIATGTLEVDDVR